MVLKRRIDEMRGDDPLERHGRNEERKAQNHFYTFWATVTFGQAVFFRNSVVSVVGRSAAVRD